MLKNCTMREHAEERIKERCGQYDLDYELRTARPAGKALRYIRESQHTRGKLLDSGGTVRAHYLSVSGLVFVVQIATREIITVFPLACGYIDPECLQNPT